MKVLEVSGSPREMGWQIGRHFKNVLQRKSASVTRKWMNEETEEKLSLIERKLEQVFPEVLEELKGKAEGAEIPLSTLILLNSPELQRKQDGCTTAIYKDEAGKIFLSHNEDERDFYKNNSVLIRYSYPDHWVVGYTSAEKVIGSCFGFNSYGLIFSSNYLFPNETDPTQISRYIYENYLTSASSLSEVRERIKMMKVASPFSFNVIDTKSGEVSNFEKDLDQVYETPVNGAYGRANHFLAKKGDINSSASSLFRAAKAQEGVDKLIGKSVCGEDLREILKYQEAEKDRRILLTGGRYDNQTVANLTYDGEAKTIMIRDYLCPDSSFCFSLKETEKE